MAARLRDWLKRRLGNPVALRFAFGALLGLIAAAAAIPASLAEYRVSLVFDQTSESFLAWVRDGLLRVTLDAFALGLVVALVLTLVARTRQWWIYSIVGLFAASLLVGFLEPLTVAPLFNQYQPLSETSPLFAPLRALAASAGVPAAPFYVGNVSRQTQLASARISGYGPTARIILGDTLLETETRGEILFAAARQLDLYRHGDTFRSAFVFTLLFLASIALAVVLADRMRFRGDDDPLARLALVGALAGLIGLVAYPLYNGYSRHIERKADAFAVSVTQDPASAVRAFVRAADRRFVPLCISRAAEVYFSPVPPLGTRIASVSGRRNPCR